MASDFNSIMNQYLAASPDTNPNMFDPASNPTIPDKVGSISIPKQQDVAATAWNKMADLTKQAASTAAKVAAVDGHGLVAMKNTGAGLNSANPIDRDFVTLAPSDFRIKYGNDVGERYSAAYALADAQNRDLNQSHRTNAQIVGDTANTVLAAPVQLVGGLGAMATGLVSPKYGTLLSKTLGDFTRGAQSIQSDQLNQARDAFNTEQGLHERDNRQLYGLWCHCCQGFADWS